MKRRNSRAKKHLGQNFLYDPAIARRIADASGVAGGDVVVELGPGRGIVTRELVERGARLIGLELDDELAEALATEFAAPEGGLAAGGADLTRTEILNVDFTTISLTGLLAARNLERCTLVGNIPYHHTRDVLFSFLIGEFDAVAGATLMVQKEVGERIVSPPGSRVYGITSVLLQTLYHVRLAMRVLPGSFVPRPKVASVVLKFLPVADPPLTQREFRPWIGLVKNLFQQRRKTLQNSLKAFYDLGPDKLAAVAAQSGVDLSRRPEALAKESFLKLLEALRAVAPAAVAGSDPAGDGGKCGSRTD